MQVTVERVVLGELRAVARGYKREGKSRQEEKSGRKMGVVFLKRLGREVFKKCGYVKVVPEEGAGENVVHGRAAACWHRPAGRL